MPLRHLQKRPNRQETGKAEHEKTTQIIQNVLPTSTAKNFATPRNRKNCHIKISSRIKQHIRRFFVVNTELNDYKQVMKLYKIDTPYKLFKALEDNPIPESTEIATKIFLENFLKAQYRQKQNGI